MGARQACPAGTEVARIDTLAYAQLYMDIKTLMEHFPDISIPPISVPELSSARGRPFRSADSQMCPTSPRFFFYVKTTYFEQIFTSQPVGSISAKIAERLCNINGIQYNNSPGHKSSRFSRMFHIINIHIFMGIVFWDCILDSGGHCSH